MEDWLQEFDPLVQSALGTASRLVEQRGGDALSVEDLLLVLLESRYPLAAFLQARGVDLDELVRAIQCEQPIVSVPSEADGLSRDLIAWLAQVRESGQGIPGLPELMRALTHECDWLNQRAYIAVLEQVADWQWGDLVDTRTVRLRPSNRSVYPLDSLESSAWPASEEGFARARRLAALASSESSPLLHMPTRSLIQAKGLVCCAASAYADCSGKPVAAWHVPIASLSRKGLVVSEILKEAVASSGRAINWFFLNNVSPDLLAAVVDREGVQPWAELAADSSVALILAHPPAGESPMTMAQLCGRLGLSWSVLSQPPVAGADVLRYCQNNQPRLESAIGMPVETAALRLAVAASGGRDPALIIEDDAWLEEAADYERAEAIIRAAGAMVQSELVLGPVRLAALRAREKMDEQAELLSLARGDATAENLVTEEDSLEKVANEVDWLEQARQGAPVLDQAAVLRWLESSDSVSSSPSRFWYDARCLSVVTRE